MCSVAVWCPPPPHVPSLTFAVAAASANLFTPRLHVFSSLSLSSKPCPPPALPLVAALHAFEDDQQEPSKNFRLLSNKEKKELRAYAHSLGRKLISQQVGKSGVTASLAQAISDTLEANEILKLKVLDNCPDELEEVTVKIEEATQAQVVGKIGSVLLLYRPSLRKSEKRSNKLLQSQRRMHNSAEGSRRM